MPMSRRNGRLCRTVDERTSRKCPHLMVKAREVGDISRTALRFLPNAVVDRRAVRASARSIVFDRLKNSVNCARKGADYMAEYRRDEAPRTHRSVDSKRNEKQRRKSKELGVSNCILGKQSHWPAPSEYQVASDIGTANPLK